MSECSVEYAKDNLPFKEVNGIPVKHLSWSKIFELAADSRADSNNEQKGLSEAYGLSAHKVYAADFSLR